MTFPIVSYADWVKKGQFAQLEDGKVFYVHQGEGFPVIMLHFFGGNSWWFCRVLDTFAERFSIYAVDLPGCAQSETPDLPYDVPDFASAIVEFMDKLGIEKAHLVGNSGGSLMCAEVAATRPSRVGKLVLEMLPTWTRSQAKALWRDRYSNYLDEEHPRRPYENFDGWVRNSEYFGELDDETREMAIRRMAQDFMDHAPWMLSMVRGGGLRYDVISRLHLVQSPTLIIDGDKLHAHHRQTPREKVTSALRESRLENIPGSANRSAFEQPKLYTKAVLEFLEA